MRYKVVSTIGLLSILLCSYLGLYAQHGADKEYVIDTLENYQPKDFKISDKGLSVDYPRYLFANRMLKKGELKAILPDYHPEESSLKLYSYYTIHYNVNNKARHQKIKVPFYYFQESGTIYYLDSISFNRDTFLFRFRIPAPQGHGYELSLSWKAGRINYVRYTGQGSAGSFTMCNNYVGQPIGMLVNLNHFRPKGLCYEMYYEYEGTYFIGRGTGSANNKELIITDKLCRTLSSYQLRYKIGRIVPGDDFLVTFDDVRLRGKASEVAVKKVLSSKLYRY